MAFRKITGLLVAASLAIWAATPAQADYWRHYNYIRSGGPAFTVAGSAAGLILDAAIVWNTQCRELTGQEAFVSFVIPFGGLLFGHQDNRCHK